MYLIILLCSFAAAGIGLAVRRRSSGLGQGLIIAGCIGCVAAIGWQVRSTMFTAESGLPKRAHLVVGATMASGVQSAIYGQRGAVVMVFPKSLSDSTVESYADALGGLLLRGHREWDLEVTKVDVPSKELKAGTLSQDKFKQVMAQYPKAIAFVSFAGVPAGVETLFPAGAIPPIFVYDGTRGESWVEPLKQRRLRAVVVPRPEANFDKAEDMSGPAGEVFAQLYYMATPENAAEIAAKLGKGSAAGKP